MEKVRARAYVFTVNNPTEPKESVLKDLENIPTSDLGIIGYEVGKQGTHHLQGYVHFKGPCRLSTIKNALPHGTHIEAAKGSPEQNKEYCEKDGECVLFGNFPNRATKKKITHEQIIRATLTEDLALLAQSESYMRNISKYKQLKADIEDREYELQKYYELHNTLLLKWQLHACVNLFKQNNRQIMWLFCHEGGSGKSYLARYLTYVFGYQLFDGVTSVKDIAIQLSPKSNGYVFDVTRSSYEHFSYNTLECIKNGFLFSGKYEGYKRQFDPKPTLVFANFYPKEDALSKDRWYICELQNGKKTYVSPQAQTHFLTQNPSSPPKTYLPPSTTRNRHN